jgi:hypothetical protein
MKKIITNFIATWMIATLLAGCFHKDKSTEEIVQTVDWYKANTPERAAMRTKCNANPGELAASPNCINANRAETAVDGAKRGGLNVQPMQGIKLRGN